jgi:hypothetical protein
MNFEPAGVGRRFAALMADWLMSWAVGSIFFSQEVAREFWITGIFFFQIVLFTFLTGASAGQRIFRVQVVTYPNLGPLSFTKVLLRTFLILLVIPAVVFDREGRGLHDRAASSIAIKRIN